MSIRYRVSKVISEIPLVVDELWYSRGYLYDSKEKRDHYQHMTDTQRIMVEALSLNETNPTPLIEWRNATSNETLLLDEVVGQPEAQTVKWLLESYCQLTWENDEGIDERDGKWNTSTVLLSVNNTFLNNTMVSSELAWMFLYDGGVVLFGSSTNVTLDTLPEDRWSSSNDYSFFDSGTNTQRWTAELRYYLWLP